VGQAQAERLKDIATIQGVRSNPLIGYGLVVGLDGTGDQSPLTVQGVANMLQQMGVTLPPGVNLQAKNVAGVMVTASLPAFVQPGQTLDVTVSSMGSSKSLRGGTLLMTPLKGADGQVYALAQGNVLVGGAGASGGGSRVQINHLSAGRISSGAVVERAVPTPLGQDEYVMLELRESDFSTASLVVEQLNRRFGAGVASAQNGRVIQVRAPQQQQERVAFLGALESLQVVPATVAPKVALNGRTGSIVMNQAVTLDACAVAHGSLSIVIGTAPAVSQPAPLSQGQTVVTTSTQIEVQKESGQVMLLPKAVLLADVVKALNAIGASPQDLLAILQAMKAAGALRAEIEVI
jgi:flagellar P-ring protein precursor FlgI